jgi:hypothetical protein
MAKCMEKFLSFGGESCFVHVGLPTRWTLEKCTLIGAMDEGKWGTAEISIKTPFAGVFFLVKVHPVLSAIKY